MEASAAHKEPHLPARLKTRALQLASLALLDLTRAQVP